MLHNGCDQHFSFVRCFYGFLSSVQASFDFFDNVDLMITKASLKVS